MAFAIYFRKMVQPEEKKPINKLMHTTTQIGHKNSILILTLIVEIYSIYTGTDILPGCETCVPIHVHMITMQFVVHTHVQKIEHDQLYIYGHGWLGHVCYLLLNFEELKIIFPEEKRFSQIGMLISCNSQLQRLDKRFCWY